jgi:hypothetical protein
VERYLHLFTFMPCLGPASHFSSYESVDNPVGGVQTGLGAHPAFYRIGTGSFPGIKRAALCVNQPPHLAARLNNEQSYTSTPLLGLRGLFYVEQD